MSTLMIPSSYVPVCNAIVDLMSPLVETVIHDLETQTIFYIKGELSIRKIGDSSLLDETTSLKKIDQKVYNKLNYDGRTLKCISIALSPRWLLCINYDISAFKTLMSLTRLFLTTPHQIQETKPDFLFKNDWQETLHCAVHLFLTENEWVFSALTAPQKKKVCRYLFDKGAFTQKKAADYVARTLNLGRATVFKYLKEWRSL